MTTNTLKREIINYLETVIPDESINVSDAVATSKIELPSLSVAIPSAEPHSVVMNGVLRCQVEIVLRYHSADEYSSIGSWEDQIEQILNDPATMRQSLTDGIRVDFWQYDGASTDWDESVKETTFSASCLVVRI